MLEETACYCMFEKSCGRGSKEEHAPDHSPSNEQRFRGPHRDTVDAVVIRNKAFPWVNTRFRDHERAQFKRHNVNERAKGKTRESDHVRRD